LQNHEKHVGFKLKFGAKRHKKTFYTTSKYNLARSATKRLFSQPQIKFRRRRRLNYLSDGVSRNIIEHRRGMKSAGADELCP
jgi:hypothetical protein